MPEEPTPYTDRSAESPAKTKAGVTESVQATGDIIIDELYIVTSNGEVDIRNFIMEIEICEDMFANVMVGKAYVGDAAGLIARLPIQRGDVLTIHARTPTFPNTEAFAIKRSFIITGVDERMMNRDREQLYGITFMSPEGVQDNTLAISRAFSGTTDHIVAEVFEQHLKFPRYVRKGQPLAGFTDVTFVGSPNTSFVRLVSPYWSPLKIINWCAVRAVSASGKAPNFLFFESNKGFYFTSVENLVEMQRNAGNMYNQYFFGDANQRDSDAGAFTYAAQNIGRGYSVIQSVQIPTQFDLLHDQDYGYLAGTMATHDITTKEYREYTWDYGANFDQFNHQEDYKAVDGKIVSESGQHQPFRQLTLRSPDTFRTLRTKQFAMFGDYKDNQAERWALQRNSLMHAISNLRVNIQVPGRTDAEVGRLVYVQFPIGSDKSPVREQNFDPYMTGVYLITAIRHTISLVGKHTMSMELVKDSFRKSLG